MVLFQKKKNFWRDYETFKNFGAITKDLKILARLRKIQKKNIKKIFFFLVRGREEEEERKGRGGEGEKLPETETLKRVLKL